MATHRQSILGFATVPDDSGDVFFEPYDIKAANDQWKRLVAIFNDASALSRMRGAFNVPSDYVGAPKVIVVWTAGTTSGTVNWLFQYRAVGGNDTESLDQSGVQETANVTDDAPSAIHERLETPIALTAANLAADDTVLFDIVRNSTADTMAAAAIVHDVLFEYSDA